MFTNSTREVCTDKWFNGDEEGSSYQNHVFVRLIARDRKFTRVNFKYCVFDGAYLRRCTFDSCDFTGCRFINTNFHGSKFSGSTFDYATFDKTNIDNDILDTECPSHDNLKQKFARSLRVNYQQLGDVASANKAMKAELHATEVHLRNVWNSKSSYYREKYVGWKRVAGFFDWCGFKMLDYIWGNGENAWKLCRAVLVLLIVMGFIDAIVFTNGWLVISYWNGVLKAPQIFFGTLVPSDYPKGYLTVVTLLRLIAFGFFMSIIIKKFNRR